MASNNEYRRYFIILQEDEKGYEMSPGKIPTGYVKIEVKNNRVKLNAFIQNVRVENGIEYRLILVAPGRNTAVDVGKIIVDSNGRGEISHELESDNVLKSGMRIEDFNVAAVTSGASVPLSGYTGRDKMEWKGKYEIINRQKEKEAPRIDKKITIEEIVPEIPTPTYHVPEPVIEEKPAPMPMPEPEPAPVPKPEPEPAPAPMPEPEHVLAPKPEVTVEEVPVEKPAPAEEIKPQPEIEAPHIHESKVEVKIVMPECPPLVPMEEPCEIEKKEIKKEKVCEYEDIKQYYCDDDEDEYCNDSDDKKHYHHKYHEWENKHRRMHDRIKKVLRKLREYEPFEEERGYNWFRVGENICEINRVAIPFMGYMVPMGYPFMSEGCTMMIGRKDYIIGVKYEDDEDDDRRLIRYLLFGVPAIYSKRNEQYYRMRGFMTFRSHKYKSHGYFIMCLDLKNGLLCHMD